MKGKFIVIEGGDGAGKDTQIELLKKEIGEEGVVYTRDPGGTALGLKLREVLQYGENVAHQTEMLLFLASRAQLVQEVIVPSIEKGVHVISNRFDPSTIAYQVYGRRRQHLANLVRAVSSYANIQLVPDLVVFLDVSPEVGLQRIKERREKVTRFEKEELEFHERVREGYKAAVKEYPQVVVIDADKSVEEVRREVLAAVREVLNR